MIAIPRILRFGCAATSCRCAAAAEARMSAPASRSPTSSRCSTARCFGSTRPAGWPDRDRFILSKGHAGACVYAALAERGFFDVAVLEQHYRNGSNLSGHVSHKGVPGVEFSTGSLGHGLGVGAGMAFNLRRLGGEPARLRGAQRRRVRRGLDLGSGAVRCPSPPRQSLRGDRLQQAPAHRARSPIRSTSSPSPTSGARSAGMRSGRRPRS